MDDAAAPATPEALGTTGIELQRVDDAEDTDDGRASVASATDGGGGAASPKRADRAIVTAHVSTSQTGASPTTTAAAAAADRVAPSTDAGESPSPAAVHVTTSSRLCTFTRQELQALLKEADYGERVPAYDAYFTRAEEEEGAEGGAANSTGPTHRCATCGNPIGVHPSQLVVAAAASAAGPLVPFAAFAGPAAPVADEDYSLTGESTPSALAGRAAAGAPRRGAGRKPPLSKPSRARTGSLFFATNGANNKAGPDPRRRGSTSSRRQSVLLSAAYGGDVDLRKRLLPPTVSLADVSAGALHRPSGASEGTRPLVPRPLHWDGGAHWFLPFLEFDGFGEIRDEAVVGTAHQQNGRVQTRAYTRWRCTCPKEGGEFSGATCGAVFVTKGVFLNARTGRPRAEAIADFSLVWGANGGDDEPPAMPIADHFREVHGLEPATPNGWSTALVSDACESPKTALACVACPCSVPSCFGGDWRGHGFCNVLNQVAPIQSLTQYGVPARSPSEPAGLGIPCVASHMLATLCAPAFVLAGAALSVVTIATLCGFPCNSDGLPPLILFCCYKRRRNFVKALGADETPMQTRCYTVFCCPCSELQQFRELRNSGIWPGLMCCSASEADRRAMEPSAVRERYRVGGAYGVRAKPGAGPLAEQTARRFAEFPAPRIGWRMD